MSRALTISTIVFLLGALGLALIGQPDLDTRIEWQTPELKDELANRSVQIDPAELVDLMHNNQVRLVLVDVRDEADFNMFHLLDAQHATLPDIEAGFAPAVPPGSIVIVMSNGEQRAARAWSMLRARGVTGSYILDGGINRWLDVYGPYSETPPVRTDAVTAGLGGQPAEPMHYMFPAALGDRIDIAWPDPGHMRLPERPYTPKAKVVKPIAADGTGCG